MDGLTRELIKLPPATHDSNVIRLDANGRGAAVRVLECRGRLLMPTTCHTDKSPF